jgi:DhnA family fructose-bisphosphate aldolase class Ia
MLPICKNLFNFKGAPMPIVRINWSGVYCFHWNYNKAYTVVTKSVKDALAEGAEIVLISLTIGTGDEERDAMNVQVYSKLMNEAKRYGIPVIGEFFPINSDKLTADEMHERVFSSCRILSEIGADLIKTFYTQEFKKVTNSTPIPILGLGADKKPTQLEALQLAYDEISDGAKGVVFGRNAINVADPFSFQAALIDVVKRMETPEIVADKYNLW